MSEAQAQDTTIYEVSNNGVTFKVQSVVVDEHKSLAINPGEKGATGGDLLKFAGHTNVEEVSPKQALALILLGQDPNDYCVDTDTNEVINFRDTVMMMISEKLAEQGVTGLIQEREENHVEDDEDEDEDFWGDDEA